MNLITDPAANARRPPILRSSRGNLLYESRVLTLFLITLAFEVIWWSLAWILLHAYPAYRPGVNLPSNRTISIITGISIVLAFVIPIVIPLGSLGSRVADTFDRNSGTYLFTQGISRRRWFATNLLVALVMTAILSTVSASGFRFLVAPHLLGPIPPYWIYFFELGPATIGYSLTLSGLACLVALITRAPTLTTLIGIILALVLIPTGYTLSEHLLPTDSTSGPFLLTGTAALRVDGAPPGSNASNAIAFNSLSPPTGSQQVSATDLEHNKVIGLVRAIAMETHCASSNGRLDVKSSKPACKELRSIREVIVYQPASHFNPLQWMTLATSMIVTAFFGAIGYLLIDRLRI
ncbi:hypothetical protein [Ferrimicrobium sp.]|uniref:hypothetical protein n=1 Tax=Ferrimicrobium sp. TaxID=2926050 RepID=UPI00261427B3|nr:hypothetical protein [Ferrimicrobium sp.]